MRIYLSGGALVCLAGGLVFDPQHCKTKQISNNKNYEREKERETELYVFDSLPFSTNGLSTNIC
jgi:hypothetical protein